MKFLIISILLFPSMAAAGEAEDFKARILSQEEELSSVEKKIESLRLTLYRLTEREKETLGKVDNLDAEVDSKRARVAGVRADIEEINKRILSYEQAIKKKELEKAGLSDDLSCLARAYYYRISRTSRRNWVSSVFGLSRKDEFSIAYMLRQPALNYILTQKKIDETVALTGQLQKKNRQLSVLKKELVSIQNEAIENLNRQLDILRNIRDEQNIRQEKISEMEREKEHLRALIESLRDRAESLEVLKGLARDFSSGKGILPWPVEGEVVARFGRHRHPTLDTYIYNRGIEIEPSGDNQVITVAGGEVVFSDTFRGRGNMVVIDHGNNYYTIYGGLKDIYTEVGELKEPLDLIGSVSGSLYFELGSGTHPRDPLEWLK